METSSNSNTLRKNQVKGNSQTIYVLNMNWAINVNYNYKMNIPAKSLFSKGFLPRIVVDAVSFFIPICLILTSVPPLDS